MKTDNAKYLWSYKKSNELIAHSLTYSIYHVQLRYFTVYGPWVDLIKHYLNLLNK